MATPLTVATVAAIAGRLATASRASASRLYFSFIDILYWFWVQLGCAAGIDCERVDFMPHQLAKRLIDQTVAGKGRFAGKCVGNDTQAIVTTTAARTRMAGMTGTVVDYFNGGRQRFQPFAHHGDGAAQGRTFLKGFTLARAYTPALV